MSDKPRSAAPQPIYDTFIAAPMSSLDDVAYGLAREGVLAIMDKLSGAHGFGSIYFAGAKISGPKAFTGEAEALRRDLQALRDSHFFILVYPGKIVTSALVEVGYALALRLPCILLVNDRADLPYLLKQAETDRAGELLPPLRIVTFRDPEQAAGEIAAFYDEIVPERRRRGR
jgi:hypothetical protein